MVIDRNSEDAARDVYDVIVIGGGIYGSMLALEASLRDLRVLLLERDDFGGHTTYNSLKVVHGGLRDLQSLDLGRARRFAREQRWFMNHFPRRVRPLPVVIPLYQEGMLRTDLFRGGLWLYRGVLYSIGGSRTGREDVSPGRVLSPSEVQEVFPEVSTEGLKGGALWYDAAIPDTQCFLIDLLQCVCGAEGAALNYMPVVSLLESGGDVRGVRAHDRVADRDYEFRGETVINAAGPWSRSLASRFDRDIPELCDLSVAWNILFDRRAPSEHALGVTPRAGGQVYFMHPWKGRLLVGTGYAPRLRKREEPSPTAQELDAFLEDINAALPGRELARDDILHVYAGYLPVENQGTVDMVKRDALVRHAERGGPGGLFSVRGTKLTEARLTADRAMARVFSSSKRSEALDRRLEEARKDRPVDRGVFSYDETIDLDDAACRADLQAIVREEAVVHLDDLVLRRTTIGDNPNRALQVSEGLCRLFDWDENRRQEEIERLYRSLPRRRRSRQANTEQN